MESIGGKKIKKNFTIVIGVLAFMLLTITPVYAAKPPQISGTE